MRHLFVSLSISIFSSTRIEGSIRNVNQHPITAPFLDSLVQKFRKYSLGDRI